MNSGTGTLSVVDLAAASVVATISVGSSPYAVAVAPDGNRVYVTAQDQVSVITTNGLQATTIPMPGVPAGVAVDRSGRSVYFSRGNDLVAFDTSTNTVRTRIAVGRPANAVALSPDGEQAYVGSTDAGVVSVLRLDAPS